MNVLFRCPVLTFVQTFHIQFLKYLLRKRLFFRDKNCSYSKEPKIAVNKLTCSSDELINSPLSGPVKLRASVAYGI